MLNATSKKPPSPGDTLDGGVKRPAEIPQCRKDFNLSEAKAFVDQVMAVFHTLEDMTDLKTMYETGKQLSRIFFECPCYRLEIAQYLTTLDYPAYASKMMKKLNNMGVFKNDDIWFSSFYFYSTSWNFSDTLPEFATSLGTAGLPNLLNLNIGHQPYLDNISSKNVYYLIKASLSIIHNIARVPGNGHYFAADSVKQALLHLAQREEEFLRCVSTLCLAYTVSETETHLLTTGVDSIRALMNYIGQARKSEKRRCHGFQVVELLCALCALTVNDTVKKAVVDSGAVDMLKEIIDNASSTDKEIEEAVRNLWNLAFDLDIRGRLTKDFNIGTFLKKLTTHANHDIVRAVEGTQWLLSNREATVNNGCINVPSEVNGKDFALFSFSAVNREAVLRISERLHENNIPIWVPSETSKESTWIPAIEKSALVLLCLSEGYKMDPQCRAEAEFCDSLDKPFVPLLIQAKFKPSGWLECLVGARPCYDLSGRRDLSATFDQVLANIHEILAQITSEHDEKLHEKEPDQLDVNSDSGGKGLLSNEEEQMPIAVTTVTSHHAQPVETDDVTDVVDNAPLAPGSVITTVAEVLANSPTSGPTDTCVTIDMLGSRLLDECVNHTGNQMTCSLPPPPQSLPMSSGVLPYQSSLNSINQPAAAPVAVFACSIAGTAAASALHTSIAGGTVMAPSLSSCPSASRFRSWSRTDVDEWLGRNMLGHLKQRLDILDGPMLDQLVQIRTQAPEFFFRCLDTKLNFTFMDILKFSEALQQLDIGKS